MHDKNGKVKTKKLSNSFSGEMSVAINERDQEFWRGAISRFMFGE